jgi:hypothetical protein
VTKCREEESLLIRLLARPVLTGDTNDSIVVGIRHYAQRANASEMGVREDGDWPRVKLA